MIYKTMSFFINIYSKLAYIGNRGWDKALEISLYNSLIHLIETVLLQLLPFSIECLLP